MEENTSMITALIAGSVAGILVDIILFPLDTIKTRLQSSEGFQKSGGFRGIYKGVIFAALGSAPSGASFFLGYELSKSMLQPFLYNDFLNLIVATCIGEALSCLVRIPFEIVKQNAQAESARNKDSKEENLETQKPAVSKRGTIATLLAVFKDVRGMYQCFISLLIRDIPFMLIEMPIWEYLKNLFKIYNENQITGFQSALSGSIAGAISAALTTPLDVAKTRIILSDESSSQSVLVVISEIARNEGVSQLFAGVTPRVTWIALGGFIFLGAYDQTKILLNLYTSL